MRLIRRGIVVVLAVAVVAGCSGGGSEGSSPLDAVVDEARTGVSAAPGSGGAWSGPPPDAADVEAAFTTLLACMTDAGLTGTVRFDLAVSTALVMDVSLGRTEAEADEGQRRRDTCVEPFDHVMSAYMMANPQTEAERERFRSGLLDCAERFFPGELADDLSFNDTALAYGELSASSLGTVSYDAGQCKEEVLAGPLRTFGAP